MKFLSLIASAVVCVSFNAVVQAEEIIVFVHGLSGYGTDEKDGDYWGPKGPNNYVEWLSAQTGLRAFEASVGPFSSNYDRACELYAQILGRRTDYGLAHAAAQRHDRYGRDFRLNSTKPSYYQSGGFFPQWSSTNKIHFVVHSMGGTTVRQLERFLHLGSPLESTVSYPSGEPMSDLFRTNQGRNFIASVTAMATPFDGSVLHPKLISMRLNFVNIMKDRLFAPLMPDVDRGRFSFDLDHHPDFVRLPGEVARNYVTRFFKSSKWNGTYDDMADSDLSPAESKRFNAAGPRVFSGTRYFALNTVRSLPCGTRRSNQCMSKATGFYGTTGGLMGSLSNIKDKEGNVYGDEWEANDGIVSEIASRGPVFGVPATEPGAPVVHPTSVTGALVYDKNTLQAGQWYYQRFFLDHSQVVADPIARAHVRDIINAIKA